MKLWGYFSLMSLFLVSSCAKHESTGNTIETENTIAIFVSQPDGKPAAYARVEIRPVWFTADTAHATDTSLAIRNVQTDRKGWVNCEGLPQGTYIVHILGDSTGSVAEFDHVDTNAGTEIQRLAVSPLGTIMGEVNLPSGINHAWIQIYGLDKKVKTDQNGKFSLKGLPSGTYRVRAIALKSPSILAEDVVQIRSNYTSNTGLLPSPTIGSEDPATWQYSLKIPSDSLVSEWMRPLADFSVVTLKLDSSNFDFKETMDDGRDLRIFDDNGPLVFQRVLWSPELKRAVIRIRMQTSKQDSSTQIELRWGHAGAIDPGFDGLWSGISDSLYTELYTLLIDDFEHHSAQTGLPPPIPGTFWYIIPSDTSVVVDSALLADFTNTLQPAGDGRSGTAAHIVYTATSTMWFVLGAKLGPEPRSLETLDSVEFWVRGDGLYSFAFDNFSGTGGKAIFNDTLYSEWTRKCIRPSDFLPADNIGGNVGWDSVADSITNVTFFSGNGTEFWVDDIRLYGVNRDDLK